MNLTPNPQLELAYDYVQHTDKHIFLTGKAGTGKTTFLKKIKKESLKRMAVVAPTGVAAINAKGMTIHSLFQLPFGPFLPNAKQDASRQRKFTRKKINLIKSLDLVVIDEISMVRADTLDAIDSVLRKYKDRTKPFGGVQLLMIGDLHQLPPVVRPDTWNLLREHYSTPYFFSCLALKETELVTVELKHIYRQSDSYFIDLLNKVRNNQLDKSVLEAINSRYKNNFEPEKEDGYITLTSHNAAAEKINEEKLKAIDKTLYTFSAEIVGDFPQHAYPTAEKLEVKIGSQVLFIKNDTSYEKRYYNGKIGQITDIDGGIISVKCAGESEPIEVAKEEWKNVKYTLNETTKEVKEEELGTFTQFPLKLAWAITIHKSQGLTFERAIIDAAAAFAHGQVYVALSRCKSFEGIVLRSKINFSSVKTDSVVRNYSEEAERNAPDEAHLEQSKKEYQQNLIRDIFDFKSLHIGFNLLERIYQEHENTLTTSALTQVYNLKGKIVKTVFEVAKKFQPQLNNYFLQTNLPEGNEQLLERIKKAAVYFSDKIKEEILKELKQIPVVTDNQAVSKKAKERIENLQKELFIKNAGFEICKKGFSTLEYVKTKANADIDFNKSKQKPSMASAFKNLPKNTPHPDLYFELMKWRKNKAADYDVTTYEVLPTRSVLELVEILPTTTDALKKVKGIGKVKIKQFGVEIIQIIGKYCNVRNLATNQLTLTKPPKFDTKQASFDLFLAGKNIDEIAKERNLVRTTIEGHLGHYISLGKLDIFDLMDRLQVDEIETFFIENKTKASSEAKAHFGDKYSYGELKMVLKYMESQQMKDFKF